MLLYKAKRWNRKIKEWFVINHPSLGNVLENIENFTFKQRLTWFILLQLTVCDITCCWLFRHAISLVKARADLNTSKKGKVAKILICIKNYNLNDNSDRKGFPSNSRTCKNKWLADKNDKRSKNKWLAKLVN